MDRFKALVTQHLDKFCLLRYSIKHWDQHSRDDGANNEAIKEEELRLFLRPANTHCISRGLQQFSDPMESRCSRVITTWEELELGQRFDVTFGLHAPVFFGRTSILKALLKTEKYKIHVNLHWPGEEQTPLHLAARRGHQDIVRMLIENGADVNSDNEHSTKPLHLAIVGGDDDTVNILIENGAVVNISAEDRILLSPLLLAVRHFRESIVYVLLEGGADVDLKDFYGMAPLHYAAEDRLHRIMNPLIENGANINSKDMLGKTPLHAAIMWKPKGALEEILRTLLKNTADINSSDDGFNTPLHAAAENGYLDIARLLLEFGAHFNLKNTSGETPLYLAFTTVPRP